jgi:ketosteroid isomerase-like protein
MNERENMELVKRDYAAFLEGDLERAVQMYAPDVDYLYPQVEGMPFGGTWRGHDEVLELFKKHDEADEILEFNLNDFIAQGDHVVVLGSYCARARRTGREWETDFVHVSTIRDGKLQRFESYFDTAAFLEAHRP